jgi:hypothetical protein
MVSAFVHNRIVFGQLHGAASNRQKKDRLEADLFMESNAMFA